MAVARKKNIVIRVTDEERRMLGELADTNGLNVSDYVRQHIRKAHEQLAATIALKSVKWRRR